MKKVLALMLVCISLVTVSAIMFTGCRNTGDETGPLVDIEGEYKSATVEDVENLIKDMNFSVAGTYESICSYVGTQPTANIEISFDVLIDITQDRYVMSGDFKMLGKGNGLNKDLDVSFYADSEYTYMIDDGKKIKEKYSSSSVYYYVCDAFTLLDKEGVLTYSEGANSIEIADEGSVKKIKFTLPANFEANMWPETVYVVIKDGDLEGIVTQINYNEKGTKLTAEIMSAKTTKTVNKPTDLDSYVEEE